MRLIVWGRSSAIRCLASGVGFWRPNVLAPGVAAQRVIAQLKLEANIQRGREERNQR